MSYNELVRRGSLFPLLLLIVPAMTEAAEVTTWDFRNAQVPANFDAHGITATPGQDGLRLQTTDREGAIFRDPQFGTPVDAVRLFFSHTMPLKAGLLWHQRGGADAFLQLPFPLAGGGPETIGIDLSTVDNWDPLADRLGVALPAGSEVVLAGIEFISMGPLEKIAEAWRSFWTFDTELAYTINFLWGPLLTFNPVGRELLFTMQPTNGISANRVFYGLLALAAILLSFHYLWERRSGVRGLASGLPIQVGRFFIVFTIIWAVFDIRMGAEMLSYGVHDLRTFVLRPLGQKEFRNYQNFHDVLIRSLPLLRQDRYAVLVPDRTPLANHVRYWTYPTQPLFPEEPMALARRWFVFRRPDIRVNDNGELVAGDTVLARGSMLERFDETSFLFETQ
ncbi:MAG: hypothetical protein Greene041619_365 [Candidatus Peregrinibacteria bacterium Greene0416_19]|nr:MAG: hypothetical protein Greene041619_365 [Candidatus Peregrinibacteria bacterium Greene0416_19]